jgi:hypothetical protein
MSAAIGGAMETANPRRSDGVKNKIKFGDLRQLLLNVGFDEVTGSAEIIFRHEPSDTVFVFRPCRRADAVAGYNLIEVKDMLEARGFMSAGSFEGQFKESSV